MTISVFYWWGNEDKTNEVTCLRPIAGKLHSQTWTEDWLQSPWFLISRVCCQQRGESRSRWQVQSRNFPWEEQKGRSGSIQGLHQCYSLISWYTSVDTSVYQPLAHAWHWNPGYTRLSPCPRELTPHHLAIAQTTEPTCNTGPNVSLISHRRSILSLLLCFSLLFITPYFSFLTSYFSFWLELSWKWNFSGGQLDSKSPLLMCHSIHHLLFCFLWVTTCELHMGSMWKSSPIKCRPFPVHFPSPFTPLVFIHCCPSPPPPPYQVWQKQILQNCPSGTVYFILNLTQNYYFWQLNFSACLIQIF